MKTNSKKLDEKDLLMREMNHRVKNSLTLISSLLNLQSRFIKDKDDLKMFRESQNRARSVALIHEKIYKSQDFKSINLKEYLETLANDLYHAYTVNKDSIKLSRNIDDVCMDVEISIPIALILNEILTNSFKYAFPSCESGEIHIELRYLKNENLFKLTITDNGTGFSEDFNFKNTKSLGMFIVKSLVEQINGEIKIYRNVEPDLLLSSKM